MNKSVKNGQQKKQTSYGRIKESAIGGIFMPRSYRQISQYEKEIIELHNQGMTLRAIAENQDSHISKYKNSKQDTTTSNE